MNKTVETANAALTTNTDKDITIQIWLMNSIWFKLVTGYKINITDAHTFILLEHVVHVNLYCLINPSLWSQKEAA